MDYNEIITTIITAIVIPLITWGILIARNYLLTKLTNESVKTILLQATDAAEKAVAETAQTYVDYIKDTDVWDATAQKKAVNMALDRAKEIMGQEGTSLLYSVTGSIDAYLRAAIEQAVRDGKQLD